MKEHEERCGGVRKTLRFHGANTITLMKHKHTVEKKDTRGWRHKP